MPFIVDQVHGSSDAPASSITEDLPITPQVDDIIYAILTNDGGATTIASTGYTSIGTQAANQGIRQAHLYKVSDGTETQITFTGANDDWIWDIYILRKVDVSGTPYVAAAREDWATANFRDSQALDATTAGNGALVFYSWGQDTATTTNSYFWINPSDAHVTSSQYNAVGGINAIVAHRTLPVAGNVPTIRAYTPLATDGGNHWVVAWKDVDAATNTPNMQWQYTGMLDVVRMGGNLGRLTEIDFSGATTFTATGVASTDVWTATGWTPVDGTQIFFRSVTGGGTNVVATTTRYIVRDSSGATFKITNAITTGGVPGTAIDITADVTASTAVVQTTTITEPDTIAATIDGLSVSDLCGTFSTAATLSGLSTYTAESIASTVNTSGSWVGCSINRASSIDMSGGKILCVDWSTDANWTTARIGSKGAIVVLSDGTNWVAYQLAKKSAAGNNVRSQTYIHLGSATALDSSGSINLAAVTNIGMMYHRAGSSATSNTIIFRCIALLKKGTVIGGCALSPANSYNMRDAAGAGFEHVFSNSGVAQSIDRISYQVSNGTNPTYWDSTNASQENPDTYVAASRTRRLWNVGSNQTEIEFYPCQYCTIKAVSTILAGKNAQGIKFNASSSASATVNMQAATISNKTFTNAGNIDLTSVNFSSCPQVDGGSATYTSCVFSGSTATGSSALKLVDGGKALDCSFTKGSETYAIEISGNGPVAIDLSRASGAVFSGYTNDLNITGTTGTVTITLALGQSVPTYVTAGATVVFDQPTVSANITITGAVSGSRLLVRNVTTDTTIYNDIATGYSESYQDGTTFTDGDEYLVVATYVSGTAAKLESVYSGIASASGFTVVVAQEDDTVYNTWSIDGSALTGITFNTTSIDVDLDGSIDPLVLWAEVYARYVWSIHQSSGILTLIDAMHANDAANYLFSNAVVINNGSATPVRVGGDGFARRSDGGSLFGSGNIQIDNGAGAIGIPVGSAVLPGDITAIGAEVATRSQAGELHADVRWVNDVAVDGTGTEGDPWGPA